MPASSFATASKSSMSASSMSAPAASVGYGVKSHTDIQKEEDLLAVRMSQERKERQNYEARKALRAQNNDS